jgi:hypothetical protein
MQRIVAYHKTTWDSGRVTQEAKRSVLCLHSRRQVLLELWKYLAFVFTYNRFIVYTMPSLLEESYPAAVPGSSTTTTDSPDSSAASPPAPSPIDTFQLRREVCGTPTELLIQTFDDRVFVVITQSGKVGCLVRLSLTSYSSANSCVQTSAFLFPCPLRSSSLLYALSVFHTVHERGQRKTGKQG